MTPLGHSYIRNRLLTKGLTTHWALSRLLLGDERKQRVLLPTSLGSLRRTSDRTPAPPKCPFASCTHLTDDRSLRILPHWFGSKCFSLRSPGIHENRLPRPMFILCPRMRPIHGPYCSQSEASGSVNRLADHDEMGTNSHASYKGKKKKCSGTDLFLHSQILANLDALFQRHVHNAAVVFVVQCVQFNKSPLRLNAHNLLQ